MPSFKDFIKKVKKSNKDKEEFTVSDPYDLNRRVMKNCDLLVTCLKQAHKRDKNNIVESMQSEIILNVEAQFKKHNGSISMLSNNSRQFLGTVTSARTRPFAYAVDAYAGGLMNPDDDPNKTFDMILKQAYKHFVTGLVKSIKSFAQQAPSNCQLLLNLDRTLSSIIKDKAYHTDFEYELLSFMCEDLPRITGNGQYIEPRVATLIADYAVAKPGEIRLAERYSTNEPFVLDN